MRLMIIVFFTINLFAQDIIMPHAKFVASGAVTDIYVDQDKLYASTDASSVDIFDLKSQKLLERIKVAQIKDFMGDIIDSKVYSSDKIGTKILVLSQAKQGFRRIHIYENEKLELIIPYTDRMFIAKAKFLDENRIILALLSNELIVYDLHAKKELWHLQVSQSKFSNFVLSETKKQIIIADESGDLQVYNTDDGSHAKTLSGKNLDNVFQVDVKQNIIATAGQDRRVVIYMPNTSYYKNSGFLVYSVGLSPSGAIAGYSSDENNNVSLFNTSTQSKLGTYGGNKMNITNIYFLDEKNFLVSSDDNTINLYKRK